MPDWNQPRNDGWEDVDYDFGLDEQGAADVSHILNEACHVFFYHRDGYWKSTYKEEYAKLLSIQFKKYPQLSARVLKSNDRVVKMVAYRALEILKV